MDIQSHFKSKNIDGELNIIPFIDLLSVLIIFLLFTSVWSQLSMIELGNSIYGKQTDKDTYKIQKKNKSSLSLSILKKGYLLRFSGKNVFVYKKNKKYDNKRLTKLLKVYKKRFPKHISVALSMSDKLEYQFLIDAMDTLLAENLSNLSISAGNF